MTALTSLAHNGGQSFGVTALFRREKVAQPDGTVEEVPILSGNGLRGMLRDRGMLHMLRSLGYGEPDADGHVPGLSLAAFYFLLSGGALTRTGVRGLDLADARRVRDLIPLVGVFGGAMGNQIMPGKLKVGKAMPICAETIHLLPARYHPDEPQSYWSYLQQEMYTRKDDAKDERRQPLLAPDVRGLLEVERAAGLARRDRGDADEDVGQHQQMRYYVETLAAGTRLYWKLVLDDVTDLEFDALLTTLVEFSRAPYVGGKSAVGLGEVAVQFEDWMQIDSRAHLSGTAISVPAGALYATHLRERGEEVRAWLRGL